MINTKVKITDFFYRISILSAMAVAIGLIASFSVIGFIEGYLWLNDVLLISQKSRSQNEDNQFLLNAMTIIVPTIGGVIVGMIIYYLTKEKRPLTPMDTIKIAQFGGKEPAVKSGFTSTIAAMLSLGVGASVGQYGPMVYLGSLLGSVVSKLKFKIQNIQTIAIACGVAACIATALNAPIGGLIFAHEVILRHYSMQAFAPTTVASVTGFIVTNIFLDRPTLFLINFENVSFSYEFLLFAIIGMFGSLIAIIYMRLILNLTSIANSLSLPQYLKPALAGMVLGIIAIWLPEVLGIGKETLKLATVENAFTIKELTIIIIAKTLLTALCIGFGFAGGVFSPALLIGTLFGAFFWTIINNSFGLDNSGIVVYAICAMVAVSSPVIGAPLTMILIVFELTRNYELAIAAMVSAVFANLLSYRIFGRSLFDVQLKNKNIDLSQGREEALLKKILLAEFDKRQYVVANIKDSIDAVIIKLTQNDKTEIAVIDDNGFFKGIIHLHKLYENKEKQLTAITKIPKIIFKESTTLWDAMLESRDFIGEAIAVVDADNKLTNMLSEAELMKAYFNTVHNVHKQENAIL